MQVRLLFSCMHSGMDSDAHCKVLFCGAVHFYTKNLFFFYKFLHLSWFSSVYYTVWIISEYIKMYERSQRHTSWNASKKKIKYCKYKHLTQNSQVGYPFCTYCTLQNLIWNKSSLQLCNKWDSVYYAHKLICSLSAGNIIPLWDIHSRYMAFALEQIDFPCVNFILGSRFLPYGQLIFYCWCFTNPVQVSCTR